MPLDPAGYAPVTTDPDAEVLERAARIIEERGWCQWHYGKEDGGPVCATKAVWIAIKEFCHWDFDFNAKLGFSGIEGDFLTVWQDRDGRTAVEVIGRLRTAARG